MQYMIPVQVLWVLVLIADVLISPLKAYYSEGLLIKDVGLIFKEYTRRAIYVDLTGIIIILVPLAVGWVNIYVNWLKILWFIKLYTIDKINDEFQRITQLYIIRNTIFLVSKLIIFSIIYAHFYAIFFYLVSYYLYVTNYYGPNTPMILYLYNSWAIYQMVFLPWYDIYAYIMYTGVAFVTTIAYGDVTPKNPI